MSEKKERIDSKSGFSLVPTDKPDEKAEKSKKVWRIISTVLHILLIVISVTALFGGIYLHKLYPHEQIEEMVFYLFNGAEGSDSKDWIDAFTALFIPITLVSAILIFLQYDFFGKKLIFKPGSEGKKTVRIWPVRKKWILTPIVAVILIAIGLTQVGGVAYLRRQFSTSDFLENNYVDPKQATVTAPAQKRNLIVIEVESLETTLFTRDQGGVWDREVIPEMYALLSDPDAVYFSSNDEVRGTLDGYGTTWTTASLIANTSGLPFKVPAGLNNSYHSDHFLMGAYTLGDILAENGYENVMISASRTSFGGVGEYFTCHGNYDIIDVNSLSSHGLTLPDSQKNSWGFGDEATMRYARQTVEDLQTGDGPWHLLISTIDAHFTGYTYEADPANGYTGSETGMPSKVENVYATTSREIGAFIDWLKSQPCYENTTVVIFGDHINMFTGFCNDKDAPQRARYNVILNSVVSCEQSRTKNRKMTAFDFYPTMLAAAGFRIEGDALGIGVNLFSDKETLVEINGLSYVNSQLEARSDYYISHIMGEEDYLMMENKAKQQD